MVLELTLQQAIPNAILRNNTVYERIVYGSFRKTTKAKQRLEELLLTLRLAQKTIQLVYFVNYGG